MKIKDNFALIIKLWENKRNEKRQTVVSFLFLNHLKNLNIHNKSVANFVIFFFFFRIIWYTTEEHKEEFITRVCRSFIYLLKTKIILLLKLVKYEVCSREMTFKILQPTSIRFWISSMEKIFERICITFCVNNKIKCSNSLKFLTVTSPLRIKNMQVV